MVLQPFHGGIDETTSLCISLHWLSFAENGSKATTLFESKGETARIPHWKNKRYKECTMASSDLVKSFFEAF